MKKAYHIMGGLLCGACLGLAASCGQMEDEAWGNGRCDAMENAEVREGTMFLDVRLSVGDGGPSKRGNPAGGEDGDGREPGNDDENAVTGLTVFLFPNEADLNSETGRAQPVLAAYYFDGGDLSQVGTGVNVSYATKKPLDVSDLNLDQCKVLAVVNADYSGNFENGTWTTLADLRDWQTGNDLWREATDPQNIRKTNFLMSSTELATVTDIRNSTEASPAKAVVYVERLAARVDYRTGRDVFDVVDGGQNTVGEVEITGAALVNRLDGDVNLLKHVSDDYTEEVADAAIGRGEAADGGRATNWVVDAYETADKKFGDFLPTLTEDAGWEDLFSKGLPMTASNGTKWNCLGYVRENTNRIQGADELRRYATGVVFRAQYNVKADGFTEGGDIFKYGNGLYATLEAAGEAAGAPESVTVEDCAGYGITYYPKGVCYYTYWIKHADDGDDTAFGTMEYAIVRNNLYQLTVTSVSGIGDPQPGDSELTIEVAVRNWQAMDEENVDLQ